MSSSLDELLDFCRRYPVAKVDAERFLRHLSSGAEAIVDLRDKGWLGVILNRASDPFGAFPFEWIGAKAEKLPPEIAKEAIARIVAQARFLNASSLHFFLGSLWDSSAVERLKLAGAVFCYCDWDMCHKDGQWGPDLSLPKGWRWQDVNEDSQLLYIDLLRKSFGRQPGLYMPSDEDIKRGLMSAVVGARLLFDGGKMPRALLRCQIERRYVHAIARDPAYRGMGLGQMALDEARRLLERHSGPGPIRLSVVRENKPATSLYQRLGFEIESEIETLALDPLKARL